MAIGQTIYLFDQDKNKDSAETPENPEPEGGVSVPVSSEVCSPRRTLSRSSC